MLDTGERCRLSSSPSPLSSSASCPYFASLLVHFAGGGEGICLDSGNEDSGSEGSGDGGVTGGGTEFTKRSVLDWIG